MDNKLTQFVKTTSLSGLLILERPIFKDDRGFFREIFHKNELEAVAGMEFNGVQMNHSRSNPGILRGLHAEKWNKVITSVNGEAFLAIVDIRPDSPTFGKYETFTVDDENRFSLFIPKGMANSIYVSGEDAVDYFYLVDAYYDGTDTRAVAWDDPDLNIPWPNKNPILSQRDKNNPKLRELFPEKFK